VVYVCSLLINPPVYCFPYTPFNSCNKQNPVELILTEALLRARTLTSIQTRKFQVLPHAEHSLSPPDNIHLLRTSCETHKYIMQQKATFHNVTAGGTARRPGDGRGGGGFSSMQCGGVLTASGNYWTATGRSSTALQLYTDWKHEAFRGTCNERLHCPNALSMGSSNSWFATKFCACACIAFLTGIISWSVDLLLGFKWRFCNSYCTPKLGQVIVVTGEDLDWD